MTDDFPPSPALLPPGFSDVLPPEAQVEAEAAETLMRAFRGYGYERVTPPLFEFEESLLSGSGAAVAEQTFRVLDPQTHRMMGIRPDITPQIARIAATRLVHMPRPLRLSYCGLCLMMAGAAPAMDRQLTQAGVELIGVDSAQADAEMIIVAAEALAALGVKDVSFDLTMPPLIPALIEQAALPEEVGRRLMRSLDRKDVVAVRRDAGALSDVLEQLLYAAGPAQKAIRAISAHSLPPGVEVHARRLEATIEAIAQRRPDIRLTVDPVEFRGWKYHTGVCVGIYAAGYQRELGRGGRYISNNDEPACGLTFQVEALLQVARVPARPARLLVPAGADINQIRKWQAEGFITVGLLDEAADLVHEARRLQCSHYVRGGRPCALDTELEG